MDSAENFNLNSNDGIMSFCEEKSEHLYNRKRSFHYLNEYDSTMNHTPKRNQTDNSSITSKFNPTSLISDQKVNSK